MPRGRLWYARDSFLTVIEAGSCDFQEIAICGAFAHWNMEFFRILLVLAFADLIRPGAERLSGG